MFPDKINGKTGKLLMGTVKSKLTITDTTYKREARHWYGRVLMGRLIEVYCKVPDFFDVWIDLEMIH